MSQTNSALMSMITQFTKQFVDRISELENVNRQLKLQLENSPSVNKAEFDRLAERHNELKASYAEIERENTKLRQDMDQLVAQQNSIQTDVSEYFNKVFGTLGNSSNGFQTPTKQFTNTSSTVVPNQTPAHRNAKATTKLLNTEYESDSELTDSDDELVFAPRKIRFNVGGSDGTKSQDPNKSFMAKSNEINLSDVLPNQEDSESENEDYESILKHIITEGLMNGLENINRSPHARSTQSNQPNQPDQSNQSDFLFRPQNRMSKRNRPSSSKKQTEPSKSTENSNQQFQPQSNPFGFAFGPGQPGTPNANPHANPNANANANPSSSEAQLVQKILESIFNPPSK